MFNTECRGTLFNYQRGRYLDDCGKGESVTLTASGGGGCGELCLEDLPDEIELVLIRLRGGEDMRRFLTQGVVPREQTILLKATSRGIGRF